MAERPDWRAKAQSVGFDYAQPDGKPYWDETVAYLFTLRQIEDDIEKATSDLIALSIDFVKRAIRDEAYLIRLGVPSLLWDWIAESWNRGDPTLYGRFDFAYAGKGPPKLLEFNADTPTTLYESAVFQWLWLEDQIAAGALPRDTDQFNSLHDKLIDRLASLPKDHPIHMTTVSAETEDRKTVEYLGECALAAGHRVRLIDIAEIGLTAEGRFVDDKDQPIGAAFKLYPWEWLVREEFAVALPRNPTRWLEPPWKMLLSTKALMAELWKLAPGHPNLLPAAYENDPDASSIVSGDHVDKPIFSREGANVRIVQAGRVLAETTGAYGRETRIVQAFSPPASFDGMTPVIGAWMVDDRPAGIGIREEAGPVTTNLSRFVPHAIVD